MSPSTSTIGKKPLLLLASIPDEVLLSNIFIRLPAKQVARMRSLSKTWNALLSRPSFIKSHLDRSINTNDEILVVFYEEEFSCGEPFTAHPCRSPCLDVTNLIKLPRNAPSSGCNTVIGSVNGLICFTNDTFDPYVLHIWNPSLSALTALPPYTTYDDDIVYPEYDYCFRFGFDPKSSDYKVVKIAFGFIDLNGMIEELLPVEVYSMRKDSWELITQRFPSHVTCIYDLEAVYVDGYDGHVHWLCYIDTELMLQTIIAFDLNLETFSEILLPDCIQAHQGFQRRNVLGVLSQKLCVISCIADGDCEVWVMDEYGVASSWTKLHVLSEFGGNIIPIGFTLNSEFLFGHDLRLALYDPSAAASKLFKVIKPVDYVAPYIDSLVWPVAPAGRHHL